MFMKKFLTVVFLIIICFCLFSGTQKIETIELATDTCYSQPLAKNNLCEELLNISELDVFGYIPSIVVTEQEREMLARLVYLESGICSQECQRAVASVVFNRLHSGSWKQDMNADGVITLYDIIYFPNAFTPAYKIPTTIPKQECYDAVDYVLKNGCTVPEYVRYFRIDYDFKWKDYCNYCVIDNTYFGYFSTWEITGW